MSRLDNDHRRALREFRELTSSNLSRAHVIFDKQLSRRIPNVTVSHIQSPWSRSCFQCICPTLNGVRLALLEWS